MASATLHCGDVYTAATERAQLATQTLLGPRSCSDGDDSAPAAHVARAWQRYCCVFFGLAASSRGRKSLRGQRRWVCRRRRLCIAAPFALQ
eukprot:6232816-Pyramimonas_sp.AAC.1